MPESGDFSRGGHGPREYGNDFREGLMLIRGHTGPEYRTEIPIRGPDGRIDRKWDYGRVVGGRVKEATETKAGRIKAKDAVPQIVKDRRELRRDPTLVKEWVTVKGARVDKAARDLMQRMAKEFPGRFIITELTKEQRNAAITRAQAERKREQRDVLARQMQRLRLAREREERAKQRERDEREAHVKQRARERLPQIRVIAKANDRGERVRNMGRYLDGATVGRGDVAKRSAAARGEAAERAERERVEREREQQREATDRLAQQAQREREAAANGQVRAMDGREAADLLRVSRPTPGFELPYREPPSAGSTRGGREERERARGIERDRW
ncbi:hypothetical protein [Nocardia sp. NPDC052112]|uniref:hypothetical protein n=1 Tax=Nocardia sp. NPDC052112 TaxID=3155646 RepID=UPI003436DCB6